MVRRLSPWWIALLLVAAPAGSASASGLCSCAPTAKTAVERLAPRASLPETASPAAVASASHLAGAADTAAPDPSAHPLILGRITPPTAAPTPPPPPPPPLQPLDPSKGASLLAGLKEVNYFPADNGWSQMWDNWQPASIDADMARLQWLHANAVRIIVPPNTFGFPIPAARYMGELDHVIRSAFAHGLRTHLTLFDGWSSYSDIGGSEQFVSALLAPYHGDPHVMMVELQNEIDPGNSTAMAWAQQVMPYIRNVDGGIPVTVSVTGQTRMAAVVQLLGPTSPDVWDYHYYGPADLAYTAFADARRLAGGRPIFIGESGYSTWVGNGTFPGLPANAAAREAYQEQYLRTVNVAARALGLPFVSPWILNDFVPTATPPGVSAAEYSYGLFRVDGTPKPAALMLAGAYAGIGIDIAFNNSFERSDGSVPLGWGRTRPELGNFAIDSTIAHSGHSSARLTVTGGDNAGYPGIYTTPITVITPGHHYIAQVWARGDRVTGQTRIALWWLDVAGHLIGPTYSPILPLGSTAWTLMTAASTAPPGAAAVEVHLESGVNRGTVWFDDVSFGET